MKDENQKTDELDKIKQLATYPVHHQFVVGYLTFGIPLSMAKEATRIAEQFMSMAQDRLITSFNLLELLVIMKCEVLKGIQAGGNKSLSDILEPYLNELVLDNSYLNRLYFQKHIPNSEIVPDNLGIECLVCLTEITSS